MIFFLGGRGGEEKASGHGQQGRSLDDTCSLQHVPDYRERWPRSSMPWADRCAVQASTDRRPVHTFKTMEGLLLLVPPRTPQNSGYDVYAHVVYVVMCYISITCICLLYVVICYMSVIGHMSAICLVLGSS